VRSLGENDSSLSQLSQEQLTKLGMVRYGNGQYFHVANTEDGGYHLSPATEEIVSDAVAGLQRQAQQNQQNQQSELMKISENAVNQP